MKKNWILIGGGLLAALLLFSRFGCGNAPKIGGKILVEKITKIEEEIEGDWEEVKIDFIDAHLTDSMSTADNPDIAQLENERNHFKERYLVYKERALKLLQNIQERDAKIMAALECDERSRLQESQIKAMKDQFSVDSALYADLYFKWEDDTRPRKYEGTAKGDLYETQWKATVFGKLPNDGLLFKTDVTQVSTTIEKPVEVWRKNQIDLFGGLDTDIHYLLGIGYERQLFDFAGLYGQAEYYPQQKRVVGKGGLRIHF